MPPDLEQQHDVIDPSLRESLSDAFDKVVAVEPPAPATEPEAKPPRPAPEPKAADGTQAEAKAAAAAQAARDEQGRFAKQSQEVHKQDQSKPNAQPADGDKPAAQAEAIVAPAAWSATAKAKFGALDPDVQKEVLRREREMDQGRAQWGQGAERLNRLDQVLRPRLQRLAVAGVDEATAIHSLFAAQDFLESQPVDALIYLGRQSGVDWRALFQRVAGDPNLAQARPVDPALQQVQQHVATLSQTIQAQQQAARESELAGHAQTVQSFAADPKNVYFENVRSRMAQLIRSGAAATVDQAYDQACWADPEIRGLMLQQQQQNGAAASQAQQRAKADQAKKAAGSVTGSPLPGAAPGSGRPSAHSLRDDLADAWDALA